MKRLKTEINNISKKGEKIMKKFAMLMMLVVTMCAVGCRESVGQGELGRVKTSSGWSENKEALAPGLHSCYGFDEMFKLDATEKKYEETMDILVGGKVNLTITIAWRGGVDTSDKTAALGVFDKIAANENGLITHKSLYDTYVQTILQSAPKKIIGVQPDVETVVLNRTKICEDVQAIVTSTVDKTLMKTGMVEVTNFEWPRTITTAQEKLAGIKLKEEEQAAMTRAELKKAEGQLKIEEANKLVELKKAEAIAESIDIIKDKLAGAPEYLQWHTVRAMSEAAIGPNNTILMFPYNMPGIDSKQLVSNANLKQMLDQPAETKKK